MATTKTINTTNTVHRIDDQGAQQGWGERYHDLQVDQIDALNSLSGASDIAEAFQILTVSQTNAPITGMAFDVSDYVTSDNRTFMGIMDYTIKKIDGGTFVEAGTFLCTYDGANFDYTQETVGDNTGVTLEFTSSGQATYTHGAGAPTTFVIRYKARTISNLE